jgi:hypothetical protein
LGVESEGESVVTSGREREGDLTMVVGVLLVVAAAEAGDGTAGGGFDEVVGRGELGFGEGVS